MHCVVCHAVLRPSDYYAGRPRLYCSNRCRQQAKWSRQRASAAHFVSDRYVRQKG